MEIRPVDLPALRDQVVTSTEGRAALARRLFAENAAALSEADLFHVSEGMTMLAAQAAASMPNYLLAACDLPSRCGLIAFASPLTVIPFAGGHKIAISGVGWLEREEQGRAGASFLLLGGRDETISINDFTADQAEVLRAGWARLHPTAIHHHPFGDAVDKQITSVAHEGVVGDVADYCIAALKQVVTAWNLMGQAVAEVSEARYDRASIRRLAREGKQPERVRVITLRRPRAEGTGTETDREYHHQWIVRGHWRQQWYPVRQVHRPVWIAPHIKGPEGLPLLGGEKVYALRR